jgi:hypothetical protein
MKAIIDRFAINDFPRPQWGGQIQDFLQSVSLKLNTIINILKSKATPFEDTASILKGVKDWYLNFKSILRNTVEQSKYFVTQGEIHLFS